MWVSTQTTASAPSHVVGLPGYSYFCISPCSDVVCVVPSKGTVAIRAVTLIFKLMNRADLSYETDRKMLSLTAIRRDSTKAPRCDQIFPARRPRRNGDVSPDGFLYSDESNNHSVGVLKRFAWLIFSHTENQPAIAPHRHISYTFHGLPQVRRVGMKTTSRLKTNFFGYFFSLN